MYETILYEKDGGVTTISLNQVLEIHDAAGDEGVRCIVLRGEGRGFSAERTSPR